MEHLIIEFNHGIRDISPYYEIIKKIKYKMQKQCIGEFLGDDMAIDGGNAEAIFSCPSAKDLFNFIKNDIQSLSCMKHAKVTFIFGELESDATQETFLIGY